MIDESGRSSVRLKDGCVLERGGGSTPRYFLRDKNGVCFMSIHPHSVYECVNDGDGDDIPPETLVKLWKKYGPNSGVHVSMRGLVMHRSGPLVRNVFFDRRGNANLDNVNPESWVKRCTNPRSNSPESKVIFTDDDEQPLAKKKKKKTVVQQCSCGDPECGQSVTIEEEEE